MAAAARSAKKAAKGDGDARVKKGETAKAVNGAAAAGADEEDDPPMPLVSRAVIVILTSYVAEKIWRHRSFVSDTWYADSQSMTEQAMITAFEYTLAMGLLFFVGILISVATVTVQKKVFGL